MTEKRKSSNCNTTYNRNFSCHMIFWDIEYWWHDISNRIEYRDTGGILCAVSAAEMCGQERFREHAREPRHTLLRIRACVCRRIRKSGQCGWVLKRMPMCRKLILSGGRERCIALSCRHLKVVMSLTANTANGKTWHGSCADACGCGQYFWQKRKCLRPHISHLQWRASIATAATACRVIKRTTYEVVACLRTPIFPSNYGLRSACILYTRAYYNGVFMVAII